MFVARVTYETTLALVNGILIACGRIDGRNYIRELATWLSQKLGTDASHLWEHQVIVAFYAADNGDIHSVISRSQNDCDQLRLIEAAINHLNEFLSQNLDTK